MRCARRYSYRSSDHRRSLDQLRAAEVSPCSTAGRERLSSREERGYRAPAMYAAIGRASRASRRGCSPGCGNLGVGICLADIDRRGLDAAFHVARQVVFSSASSSLSKLPRILPAVFSDVDTASWHWPADFLARPDDSARTYNVAVRRVAGVDGSSDGQVRARPYNRGIAKPGDLPWWWRGVLAMLSRSSPSPNTGRGVMELKTSEVRAAGRHRSRKHDLAASRS